MESIKRSIMLLKPGDSHTVDPGKNGGTLKLQSAKEGVILTLLTDCINDSGYSLYLFLKDDKECFAGDIVDGQLNTVLNDINLENIKGAAIVYKGNDHFSFCLRSTGIDWTRIIERFKLTRTKSLIKGVPLQSDTLNIASLKNEIEEDTLYAEQSIENNAGYDIKQDNFICDTCPHVVKQDKINPFPSVFPNSEWIKISYPGPTGWWHYISGKIYKGSTVVAKALGVPGEYGMAPPIWLEGFGSYLRCVTGDARGYWLMFQDAETGEVLDMDLSPRGG
ncbi:MAG: hypothetical protein ACOX8Q_00760 [Christensenellales bacterium]|jgi:hypothetical protein